MFKLLVFVIVVVGSATAAGIKSPLQLLHQIPQVQKKSFGAVTTEHFVDQRLDNFDPQNNRTWPMRYLANDEHFRSGGPIFIVVGGEWTISDDFITGGHFYDIAREHHAYLFYTEHRFYGKSRPTANLSIENLRFLTVDQSLADLAHCIEHIKNNTPGLMLNSPVVLFGLSYSGMMVTWFRQKYPHLSIGGWASSAPINAIKDFYEYTVIIGKTIKTFGGQECYDFVENFFNQTNSLFEAHDYETLEKQLRVCDPLVRNDKWQKWYVLMWLGGIFGAITQGNRDNMMGDVCDQIMSGDTPADGVMDFLMSLTDEDCFNTNGTAFLEELGNFEFDERFDVPGFVETPWRYQTCTEFGFFQTTTSGVHPFGDAFPVDALIFLCQHVYDKRFTSEFIQKQVDRTNIIYGGLSPAVTNVISIHGSLDPWFPAGLSEDYNESCPVIVVPYASHCMDIESISEADSPELKAAKERVAEEIAKWLNIAVHKY